MLIGLRRALRKAKEILMTLRRTLMTVFAVDDAKTDADELQKDADDGVSH